MFLIISFSSLLVKLTVHWSGLASPAGEMIINGMLIIIYPNICLYRYTATFNISQVSPQHVNGCILPVAQLLLKRKRFLLQIFKLFPANATCIKVK